VKQGGRAAGARLWWAQGPLALVAGFAVVIAGCSTSTNPSSSINHRTSTHKRAPVPTVTAVAPTSGPTAGGTTVTVTGTGFTGATKVAFGPVAATSFTVVSDTKITAVSPVEAASMQTIFVTTSGGTSTPVVAVATFFFDAPVPTVTVVAPTSGPTAGGTTVTITGSGFIGAGAVAFGPVPATSFSVVSDSEITAVAPAQAASTRAVFVTTAGGTSAPLAGDEFNYKGPAPSITTIAPTSGPTAGGTTVTVTGTGFTGATKVAFGPVPATSFTVVSDTEITAVAPAQAAGTRAVTVTTSGATNAPAAGDLFSYKP